MLIKNTTPGEKGIYTTTGLVMIAPGATVEVELAEGEEPAAEWFATPGDDDDLAETPEPVEMPVKKPVARGKAKA